MHYGMIFSYIGIHISTVHPAYKVLTYKVLYGQLRRMMRKTSFYGQLSGMSPNISLYIKCCLVMWSSHF